MNLSVGPMASISNRNVGLRTITPYGAVDPNYAITYRSATLDIVPAPLIIMVNIASKYYGESNPTFTYTVSGLVNGDTMSAITVGPRFATSCTTTSLPNNQYSPAYTVTAFGAVAPDYTISYVSSYIYVKAIAPPVRW